MRRIYYRFLQLLIEKPIYKSIIIFGFLMLIQIISIRVIWAEEYYHPFMGEKIMQPQIDENNNVIITQEYLKKSYLYCESKKIFHWRMSNHVKTIMNCFYTQIHVEELDPQMVFAYQEIVRKFHHFYLDSIDEKDMARECINFCKQYIPDDAWSSKSKIGNLNTIFMLLATILKSPEEIGETLFLHAVMTCYDAKTKNLLDNEEFLYYIFLERLTTVQFENFLTNPFVNNIKQ